VGFGVPRPDPVRDGEEEGVREYRIVAVCRAGEEVRALRVLYRRVGGGGGGGR